MSAQKQDQTPNHTVIASECVFSVLEACWVITMEMSTFSLGSVIGVHKEGKVDFKSLGL